MAYPWFASVIDVKRTTRASRSRKPCVNQSSESKVIAVGSLCGRWKNWLEPNLQSALAQLSLILIESDGSKWLESCVVSRRSELRKPSITWLSLLLVMASLGFGTSLAEAYAIRKMYKEKMKKIEQEEGEGEEKVMMKLKPKDQTSSGCFSWVSNKKQQSKKNSSRVSDSNNE
ncbi:hypothetical protein PIB30_068807 [Stylosanthes scabra]|uniref:Transmembrane protein n=1 Tax=Stylosanthes scabra TaxID=79078 RepID=A0ABU6YL63_9FABA|nr:hypothetical protein [Stylosanthes scabra]